MDVASINVPAAAMILTPDMGVMGGARGSRSHFDLRLVLGPTPTSSFFLDLLSRLGLVSSEAAHFFPMSIRSMEMEKMDVTTLKKAMGWKFLEKMFSGIQEPPTPNRDAKSPIPKPSSRSVTPKRKPHVSVSKPSSVKIVTSPNEKTIKPSFNLDRKPMFSSLPAKPMNLKEISSNSADTNKPKSRATVSDPKPRSRGVSPSPTPIIPAAIHGFSPETPPNMRTQVSGRPSSVSRGRPGYSIPKTDMKQDIRKQRTQSWSPSLTRERNAEILKESGSKGKNLPGNGSMVIGSRMVEKMMNARKLDGGETKDPKHKYRVSDKDISGIGRTVSEDSLNLALKRMV
ncbi:uncharacterized protein LOC131247049 [Magnolia sinica]|uniref:uncharacterized protein LOC131247049 n=1 Tax=Magnolia sinica TaxID=86752 RepID=UPI002658AC70|nr:uncharacterized protein LOC131247049 [Magnolia sinica]